MNHVQHISPNHDIQISRNHVIHISTNYVVHIYTNDVMRGGGLGSRPKKWYGERLGDGVEYHLMKPTPRH